MSADRSYDTKVGLDLFMSKVMNVFSSKYPDISEIELYTSNIVIGRADLCKTIGLHYAGSLEDFPREYIKIRIAKNATIALYNGVVSVMQLAETPFYELDRLCNFNNPNTSFPAQDKNTES